jgi:hypothetical protein
MDLHMQRNWLGSGQLEELFWSSEIAARHDGVTLSDHCVIADEDGDAVEQFMGYADTGFEELSATTWVRKTFELDDPKLGDATICIAGDKLRGRGRIEGTFNGTPFSVRGRTNCKPWYSWWTLIPVPGRLRKGANELVLRTTGSLVWRLFIVPSHAPNRSARSIDAGLTWDDEHLGKDGFLDGEYVIRLSGKRVAPSGTITSPPVQIAEPGRAGSAGRVAKLSVSADADATVEVRLGTGPWTDRPGVWTAWSAATKLVARKLEKSLAAPGPRFVQFRLTLQRARTAPVLREVAVDAQLKTQESRAGSSCYVTVDGPTTVLSGRVFAHQRMSEKLAFLRDQFGLDGVFSGDGDEWTGLLRLAAWVGDYCSNRVSGVELVPRPIYETQMILELGHEKRASVHCGGLAFALVELAAAFGLTGRVICRGNHLVTEFWSPVHRKWAVVDPMDQLPDPETGEPRLWTGGFGGYYCRKDGVPLSAAELGAARGRVGRRHFVWASQQIEERRATTRQDLRWFRREVSYVERNNYVDVTDPPFRADVFRYCGHLKLRRSGEPLVPWYPTYTARRGDVEWTVGETSVFATAMPDGAVRLQFRSQLPNTVACDVNGERIEGDEYIWRPGSDEELSVAAMNALGQRGPATRLACERRSG